MTPSELEAALARDKRWMKTKIRQRYTVYDLGIDPVRDIRSKFYEVEKTTLRQANYPTIKIK